MPCHEHLFFFFLCGLHTLDNTSFSFTFLLVYSAATSIHGHWSFFFFGLGGG